MTAAKNAVQFKEAAVAATSLWILCLGKQRGIYETLRLPPSALRIFWRSSSAFSAEKADFASQASIFFS